MGILVGVLIITAALVIHEFAHFAACLALRIPVKALYIGLPLGPIFRIGQIFGYPLYLSPILFGAAVELGKEGEGKLNNSSLWKQGAVYLSGPLANLLSVLVVTVAYLGLERGLRFGADLILFTAAGLLALVMGILSVNDLSGPVGIIAFSSQTVSQGDPIRGVATLFVIISAALGVFNLAPIPGLDGGQFFVSILVKLGLPRTWARRISGIFFLLLIGLLIFVTIQDIGRLIR